MARSTIKPRFNEQAAFPAIVLYDDGDVTILDEVDAFVTCRTIDVSVGDRGRFAKSRVVDSNGVIWPVNGASVLEGTGPFWGYKILRPRSVRVEPNIQGEPKQSNLAVIRAEICERLRAPKSTITIQSKKVCSVLNHRRAIVVATAIESASAISEILLKLLSIELPEG